MALLGHQEILQADGLRGILENGQLKAARGLRVHWFNPPQLADGETEAQQEAKICSGVASLF